MTRVAFLVNGGTDSAMAQRARAFAERLAPDFSIDIAYRQPGRLAATLAFRDALRRGRPALAYVFDHAVPGVLAGSWYQRATGSWLVIDTGDAITALARSRGRGMVGLALTGWLERYGYRVADHVVVRGTRHQEWLSTRGIASTLIPDGVDTAQFAPRDPSALRQRLGLEHTLTIGLIGSSVWSRRLGTCYGWDLVELIYLLRDAPVTGVMIGDGSGIAHLKGRCAELDITGRVHFLGRVPYDQLPEHLSALDVCLSTQTNDLAGQVRTTGKLPLYLAAGRYILASRVGEAALVLPDDMLVDYHGVVDRDYPARLAERVRALLANPHRLRDGAAGIALARARFDYDVLAGRVRDVLKSTMSSSPGGSAVRRFDERRKSSGPDALYSSLFPLPSSPA